MRILGMALIAVCCVGGPALAQTPRDCGAMWKEADTDGNGSLTRAEDERGYFDAMQVSKYGTLEADVISRDEFMLYCEGSLERSSAGTLQHKGAEAPISRGKGDMTPGLIPFPKNEALKRLVASGFREPAELVLDDKGIWRTTAVVSGQRVPVAIDVQGEILAGG